MTQMQPIRRAHGVQRVGLSVLVLLAVGGCTTAPWQMTPEDRSIQPPTQPLAAVNRPAQRAPSGTDKPVSGGYYRVKPGDTLYRIAANHGQRSDDIVKWNNLADAGHIEPGSVLRIAPPPDASVERTAAAPQASAKAPTKRDTVDASQKLDNNPSRFSWPARGTLSAVYGQGKSKGMVIAAKAGDQVRAAAPGRVVFAGDGGKPYGKLIVIKHDDTLVTAYGHNRKLLVKEGTNVKRGETIAEMANTDRDEGSMQFEVRKDGKPVDPAPYLPRIGS
ncbi:peptidoglycan DD-metalloendopeptidase family protein [Paraburkholderia sabiae]|uniref:Peptidoglycan DD-metalloendopeptidase family protein n=1 Tax=Paraburkholderia sabiae TaxID=273251 RepID=A0ABU9QLL5_9BURK|nr:M23 family metallopeptidase [Paraburkholderia sabiae]WJZ76185.1 peptidoglycan DD-metalloendopeptidase family protein [Paraburkholderia sabiae]CAD6525842.1 Murein hydrolase activator NlpD [Paraburkholderia sabiae]